MSGVTHWMTAKWRGDDQTGLGDRGGAEVAAAGRPEEAATDWRSGGTAAVETGASSSDGSCSSDGSPRIRQWRQRNWRQPLLAFLGVGGDFPKPQPVRLLRGVLLTGRVQSSRRTS